MVTTHIIKMKANMKDAPYVVEKGRTTQWDFSLASWHMSDILPIVHQYLAASRLSQYDREDALEVVGVPLPMYTLLSKH